MVNEGEGSGQTNNLHPPIWLNYSRPRYLHVTLGDYRSHDPANLTLQTSG